MRTLIIVGALLGSLVGAVSAALFGWWLSYPTTYYTLGWCTITQAMDEYEQPWPFLLAMPLGGSLIGAVTGWLGHRRGWRLNRTHTRSQRDRTRTVAVKGRPEMAPEKWYQSEGFERWTLSLLVVNTLITVLPNTVQTVRTDPTPGHWTHPMLVILADTAVTLRVVRLWIRRLVATPTDPSRVCGGPSRGRPRCDQGCPGPDHRHQVAAGQTPRSRITAHQEPHRHPHRPLRPPPATRQPLSAPPRT